MLSFRSIFDYAWIVTEAWQMAHTLGRRSSVPLATFYPEVMHGEP